MRKLTLVAILLTLAAAAAAEGPPQQSKAKINAPKSVITVKMDGMNCTTSAGTNEFPVQAWSWGASNPVTIGGATGGAGAGKVSISSINVLKHFDQCSPALFLGVASGKQFATMTLTQEDTDNNVILTMSLEHVFVESWQLSGSVNDAVPTESVSFAFQKVCVKETSNSTTVCYNAGTNTSQ
ncbi:MAG TPA: type VI secretion system tube protein Hcp [Terriglobales bacterium]|nr:type VI secretion system tube protein Hcp [Terriglobales bacterium]